MKDEIKLSDINEIQFNYSLKAQEFFSRASQQEIAIYLSKLNQSYVILRLLGSFSYEERKTEIDFFFSEILYFSVNGNPTQMDLARKIILAINREFLNANIVSAIDKIIDNEKDDNDIVYIYRYSAELFFLLGFKSYLSNFLEHYCNEPSNQEVIEIYNDYIMKCF